LIAGVHVAVIGGVLMAESCKPKSKVSPAVTPPPGASAVGAVTPAPEVVPPPAPTPLTTTPALETKPVLSPLAAKASGTYTVVKGDTLSGIAHKQGTTVTAIKRVNNLTGDVIRVGQKLSIPSPQESGQKEIGGPAPKKTVAKKKVAKAAAKKGEAATATAAAAAGGAYAVEKGDTPEKIAKKLGVKTSALMDANPGLDPKKLRIGQKLNVPGAAPAATAAGAAPAAATPAAPMGVGAGTTTPEPAPTVPATAPSTLPPEPAGAPSLPPPPSSGPSTPPPM
jgi:LysM repeat protein